MERAPDENIKSVYDLLGANTPQELYFKFLDADQELLRNHSWDYDNSNLVINKVKESLVNLNLDSLSDVERRQVRDILWLWHHHAISCAISKKNMNYAREFSKKALFYMNEDNPNQITKLLFFLVHDQIDSAKEWLEQISDRTEAETGRDLVIACENGWQW